MSLNPFSPQKRNIGSKKKTISFLIGQNESVICFYIAAVIEILVAEILEFGKLALSLTFSIFKNGSCSTSIFFN